MSFFGRAANLIKGGIKSIGRPSGLDEARERALEEELARLDAERARAGASGSTRPTSPTRSATPAGTPTRTGATEVTDRGPPERDANGDVKRTL